MQRWPELQRLAMPAWLPPEWQRRLPGHVWPVRPWNWGGELEAVIAGAGFNPAVYVRTTEGAERCVLAGEVLA
jgi:hypothetical protein